MTKYKVSNSVAREIVKGNIPIEEMYELPLMYKIRQDVPKYAKRTIAGLALLGLAALGVRYLSNQELQKRIDLTEVPKQSSTVQEYTEVTPRENFSAQLNETFKKGEITEEQYEQELEEEYDLEGILERATTLF